PHRRGGEPSERRPQHRVRQLRRSLVSAGAGTIRCGLPIVNKGAGNETALSIIDVHRNFKVDGQVNLVGHGSWNVVQNNDDYAAIYLYNGVSLIVPQGVYLTTGELQELQQQGDQGTLNATISQGNLEVTGTAEVVMWGGTLYGWLTVDMGWV